MFCKKCGNQFEANANFCNKCGSKRPTDSVGLVTSQSVSPEPANVTPLKPKLPKTPEQMARLKKVVTIGVGVLAVIAIAIATQISLAAAEYAKYTHPNDGSNHSLSIAFSAAKIKAITDGDCDFNALYPSKNDVRKIKKHLELMTAANKRSNRAAQAFLRGASFAVEKTNQFDSDITSELIDRFRPELLKVLETNPTLDPTESQLWLDYWRQDLAGAIAGACKVPVDNKDWVEQVNKFNALLSLLKTKAANVPWYPEGYSAWSTDSNLAWKWYSGASCNTYFGSCWHIKVISQAGCPSGLYGEINIMDGGGTVIDYSNDLIGGTSPGDTVLLEFTTYNDYAETGRLTDLNCY